ncbi:hypothetical protein ACFXKI_09770 [Streptomyces mirabilis]|uniref:hypothetical protein n=1 Tax=Streptomyces mirabilis TaxID=68239 RepID=UPI0036C1ADDB
MQEPTDQPDQQPSPAQPKRLLTAALILTEAAEQLDGEPDTVLTETAWFEVFNKAAGKITDGLLIADADLAIDIAYNAVPHAPLGATRGDWQARVRQIAEAI